MRTKNNYKETKLFEAPHWQQFPPMFGTDNRGWDSYSLTGFDPKAVSIILEVDKSHIPQILLIVDYR